MTLIYTNLMGWGDRPSSDEVSPEAGWTEVQKYTLPHPRMGAPPP